MQEFLGSGTGDLPGVAVATAMIVVAAIGIGLQDALLPREMPVRMDHLPVTGELDQCGRGHTARKLPIPVKNADHQM